MDRKQLLRPPPQLRRQVAGARRRLGVGEHDGALAVGDIAPHAATSTREQRRGEQGERERPFEALGEHGIGKPGRDQLALPSPAPRPPPPGALRQGAPRQAEDARRGERRRPAAGGARLGAVDRLLQGLVLRDPQDLGGDRDRGPPLTGRAGDQLPPGEQMLPRRPRIGARPGEMERVA